MRNAVNDAEYQQVDHEDDSRMLSRPFFGEGSDLRDHLCAN